ncbi:MAG: aminotransferase class V-fold PLP-dependent enzyme [Desertimonas sp.]
MSDFGAHRRADWLLDPAVAYLNHGTVGAPPRRVIEHQRRIQDDIERHPARALIAELSSILGDVPHGPRRLREAMGAIAPFLGAAPDDVVFVDNITAGVNAVLRSFPLDAGDEIVVTSMGYGGVTNASTYAARRAGATLNTVELPAPGAPAHHYVERIDAALTSRSRILVVDHLCAQSALVLPVAAIAEAAHRRGVLVLVDGAHVPGNIPLDIAALGVDWYTANLHKWAWTPRSCGVLWCAPDHQATLHPPVVSWGLDLGMTAEFDFPGTRDISPYLAAPFAIDLLHAEGLDDLYAYNHELVWWAGQHLAERWGTTLASPREMTGSMVSVELPAALGAGAAAQAVRGALDAQDIEVGVYERGDRLTVRVSAQIYCDRDDIERLADAVRVLAGG